MENQKTPEARNAPDAGTTAPGEPVYTRFDGGSSLAEGYVALSEGAALVDLSCRTVLRLSGRDPVGLLDAVLTNRVPEGPDRGVYALLLSPKGRILADLRVIKAAQYILLDTEPGGAAAAEELLGRYAPFSRVEVENLSARDEPWGVLGVYGPRAGGLLGGLELAEHASAPVSPAGASVLAAGVTVPAAGYDLLGPAQTLLSVREHLVREGATPVDLEAYETARIMAGVPRFGVDFTPENFPAEAGLLERAVSFEKGCYPGQETVARMHYRGHPNRVLHRLAVEGPPPPAGTPVLQGGRQVGTLTSLTPLPLDGALRALGYLSRRADPQEPLRAGEATLRPL